MQRYNQRMVEQLKVRQQQEKARLPKIQRSEGKTRMAMYKKSLHISGAGSAAEQREKIKQVGPWCAGLPRKVGDIKQKMQQRVLERGVQVTQLRSLVTSPWTEEAWQDVLMPVPSHCSAPVRQLPLLLNPFSSTTIPLACHQCGSATGRHSCGPCVGHTLS